MLLLLLRNKSSISLAGSSMRSIGPISPISKYQILKPTYAHLSHTLAPHRHAEQAGNENLLRARGVWHVIESNT